MGKRIGRVVGGIFGITALAVALLNFDLEQMDRVFAVIARGFGFNPPPLHFVTEALGHPWIVAGVFGATFVVGVFLEAFAVWLLGKIIPQKTEADPLALAERMNAENRAREDFRRELDRPVESMFAIFSLTQDVSAADLTEVAGMIYVVHHQKSQCLYFGAYPAPDQRALQTEVWAYPRSPEKSDKPTFIDRFAQSGFHRLNRLEIGARMHTPFEKFEELGDAVVGIRATPRLIELLAKVSLVANGYVIFERSPTQIGEWRIPAKYPKGVKFDIDERDAWVDGIKQFQLGVALITPASPPSPPETVALINLRGDIRYVPMNVLAAKRFADGTEVVMSCSLPEQERGRLPEV